MKKFIVLVLLLALTRVTANAQAVNWFNPNSGLNFQVRSMFASPTYNKLFVGGLFWYCNGFPSEGVASYDSVNWTTYGNTGCTPYYSIIEYQGNIYASCGFFLKKWDGNVWTDIFDAAGIFDMEVYNNELYVGGSFDTIGGVPVKGIAKWNGTNWYSLGFWSSGVNSVIHYNGDLYVAGTFYDTLGNTMNIARYDGTQWHDVGGGLHGGFGFATCLEVYNGELYVGGYFTQAQGNVGNKIQKWNGTSWTDVGGGLGLGGQVHVLKVFNGELYAGGTFSEAGGIPVTYIAKWNGQQWCSLGSQIDNGITALEEFKGELYVGGGFWTIDGDSITYFAKWIGGNYSDTCSMVGINDAMLNENGIEIYPNPVSDNFIIEIPSLTSEKKYLSIYNVLGEKSLTLTLSEGEGTTSVDVSGLTRGIYIAEIRNGKSIVRKKFVKE